MGNFMKRKRVSHPKFDLQVILEKVLFFYIFLYRGLTIINCTGNTWYPLIKQCYQKPIKPIITGGTTPHFPSFLSDQ